MITVIAGEFVTRTRRFVCANWLLTAGRGLVAGRIGRPSSGVLGGMFDRANGGSQGEEWLSLYSGLVHAANADKDFGTVKWSLFRLGEACRLSLFSVLCFSVVGSLRPSRNSYLFASTYDVETINCSMYSTSI